MLVPSFLPSGDNIRAIQESNWRYQYADPKYIESIELKIGLQWDLSSPASLRENIDERNEREQQLCSSVCTGCLFDHYENY